MFPLTRRNAYLTQENVKMTRHFRPSCVRGTHEKISWHVVKGDGEKNGDKTTSHLTHGPLRTQLVFSHMACWRAFRVHCFWRPLSLIFSFISLIKMRKQTVNEVLMGQEGVDKRPKIAESNRQDQQAQ